MQQAKENVIAALTEQHIVKITGLSKGQLRSWDKRGFFSPQYAYDERGVSYSKIYSFKDAVGLKTLSKLRTEHRISIDRLEKLAAQMQKDGISHWADAKIWVVKGEPSYLRPGYKKEVIGSETGQLSILLIIDVINEVTDTVEALKKRDQKTIGHITREKFVARNSWVIAGTRIPTATILRYHNAGYSNQDILEEYPTLKIADIKAAINHEKELAKSA